MDWQGIRQPELTATHPPGPRAQGPTPNEERSVMRFDVTHHQPGQDTPAHTVTDAAGVAALVKHAAATGTRVYIRPAARPETPAPKPTAV